MSVIHCFKQQVSWITQSSELQMHPHSSNSTWTCSIEQKLFTQVQQNSFNLSSDNLEVLTIQH